MNFDKQQVVVLGGSSGIGYATAEAAKARGASVVVVSRSPRQAAERLGVAGRAADLSDPDAVAGVLADLGGIDHLVYTAGDALSLMPLADFDLGRAHGFFEVRYFGALSAVRAALPRLRPGGSITLTTGTAGDRPTPGWSVAASICGAVESLTRALAVELAPIRVNAVKPGVTRSPMWGAGEAVEHLYAETAKTVPLGRPGEVADVADAIVYLMAQSYTTGTILPVDGGALLA
jgi:NAD(P)-dependent dehydrogenase (short-subunit alcohol dehydrogenase family)